jgi:cytochrome c5
MDRNSSLVSALATKLATRRAKLFSLLAVLLVLSGSATIAQQLGRGGGGHWFLTDALATTSSAPQEAPTGFDGLANGMVDDTTHAADQAVFDEVDSVSSGLGPVYNAQSCRECHQSPVSGAISQVTELRVGQMSSSGQFTNPNVPIGDGTDVIANRSLINDRAICPSGALPTNEVQERVPEGMNVHALRTSLNTLGDGYVEAIPDTTITKIAAKQCGQNNGQICGKAISVPLLEVPGQTRIARFGWKDQHASLLSFSSDAYLNEMGVTTRLLLQDTTSVCKTTTDPEDHPDAAGMDDIDHFAQFMRASKPPSRDALLAATLDAQQGSDLFSKIGCDTCHVSSMVTAPTGSVINGGAFTVPDALGNKIIHPYSDFLLHNVGTGDGIVQNGGPASAMTMRTPPLWGVRLRTRMLHDGRALTFDDAIRGHGGEASHVVHSYVQLTEQEREQIATFLRSL